MEFKANAIFHHMHEQKRKKANDRIGKTTLAVALREKRAFHNEIHKNKSQRRRAWMERV